MGREPAQDPTPRALTEALPGVLSLSFGLSQAWPELAPPALEPGLRVEEERLPALRLRPRGAPEVLVAFIRRAVRERELRAWLDTLAPEGPLEVFLFDPGAQPPAPGLLGYLLEGGQQSAVPNREGALESMALGLSLRAEGSRLRVLLPGGEPVPFPDELAGRLQQAKAESTRWRQKAERKDADQVRTRTELERQKLRAEHWKSEARRLRERLGEASAGEEATAEIVVERS